MENNLILELIKVDLKKKARGGKDYEYVSNGNKSLLEDKFWIEIKVDVSTFEEELIIQQLDEIVNHEIRFRKIGEFMTYSGLVSSSQYDKTKQEVVLLMLKCEYEKLYNKVQNNRKRKS
ncbi:hypothetical protein [Flavobacterium succinicans]|uniref:Uncharacterized protein n=1 Tax=Flavobacterium succinicans TaxID=29536 RepID=A0A199XTB3_9FLAO|nr:hypothetical protein [Flavobacterium succinicans]OAZ04569.1 hypothetical protein FLB_10380 [Flavobacterium succinicans]